MNTLYGHNSEGGPLERDEAMPMGHFDHHTILLVDDNDDDLELTLRAMKRNGINRRIVTLRDGVEALDFLKRRGAYQDTREPLPGLMLLDLKLPRVDGLEVLEQVKMDPHLKSLPVIMLTSSRHERDVQRAYSLGVNSYICKPTDYSEFAKLVSTFDSYWFSMVILPS